MKYAHLARSIGHDPVGAHDRRGGRRGEPRRGAAEAAAEQPGTGKAAPAAAEKTLRHIGTVKTVDATSRTLIVTKKAGEVTVDVPEKASIKRGKATVKLEDVKTGEAVTVVYVQQDGKDVARSIALKAQ